MSFADPQTVTINAVTTPLPRVSVGDDRSEYASGDGLIVLTASHQQTGNQRTRRMLRLDTSKISADPYKPAQNVKVGMAVYTVFDLPPAGYTASEALQTWVGYITQVRASSDLLITKLLGGES